MKRLQSRCKSAVVGSIVPYMSENRGTTADTFDRAVAAALRAAIGERFMSQAEVARKAEIAPRTLARYFMGTSPIPVAKLVAITDAIGVSAGSILDAAKVIANRPENHRGR